MRTAILIAVYFVTSGVTPPALAQYISPPDESKAVGTEVPDARFVGERGDTITLRSLAGTPLIVSPIFTTCPHACPAITASLIEALDGLGGCGKTFNVLTFSFDPSDTPDHMRSYRDKTGMPDEWILATGPPEGVEAVLDAIDFRFEALPGAGFAHANVVVFLTPDQKVSGYARGLMYTKEEVKAALRVSSGRKPLIDRARPLLIPVAAAFLVLTILVIFLTRRSLNEKTDPPRTAP
jgi:cytochrome oxidase Cu insertion factor (SCO1/SenC/PrrC family)